MRRVDRYLLSEMATPALVGVVMMLMLLIGNVLYGLLYVLYEAKAPPHDVATILLYSLPSVLMQAVPASLLLGVALALNRLVRERELLAMRMTGTRLTRLMLPYLLVGVLFSGGLFAVQELVIPHTTRVANRMKARLSMGSPIPFIPQDVVLRVPPYFLYVGHVDPKTETLHKVIVCKVDVNGAMTWMTIPLAENHRGRWYFQRDPITQVKPRLWNFDNTGELKSYLEVEGRDSWLNLQQDALSYMADPPMQPEELPLRQLQQLQKGVRGIGTGLANGLFLTPQQLTYFLHRKFALPLSALVGILIAIPLAVRFGRSGGYVGLLISMVVAFCFVISQQWAQILAIKTDPILNPVIAAWAPDVFFGVLGLVLLWLEE